MIVSTEKIEYKKVQVNKPQFRYEQLFIYALNIHAPQEGMSYINCFRGEKIA